MICENCGMLTKPFNDGSCEFCGESVNGNQVANQSAELEKWLKGRPQVVKDIARKYLPWNTYVHKDHPDTATYQIYSINEDGTVTCNKLDFLGIPMQVFGMNPEDLVEVTQKPAHPQGHSFMPDGRCRYKGCTLMFAKGQQPPEEAEDGTQA